ncbi:MAG: hypothetical protein C0504_00115 [Candidatus Solibacter sp.]|nr:hypothetical protein [Candidatus Solibacter sp.]
MMLSWEPTLSCDSRLTPVASWLARPQESCAGRHRRIRPVCLQPPGSPESANRATALPVMNAPPQPSSPPSSQSSTALRQPNPLALTIVIPALNSAPAIAATLASVSLLPAPEVRVLVVDSGSADATLSLCQRYAVQTAYCPPGNMYRAINHGLQSGSSPWCAYLNSDDLLYPRAFLRMLRWAAASEADIVYAGADFVDADGRYLHNMPPPPPHLLPFLFQAGTLPFSQPACIFRRRAYELLNGFDESLKYSSDFDFYRRALLRSFRFARFGSEPVAAFRLSPGQASSLHSSEMALEHQRAVSTATLRPPLVSHAAAWLWRLASSWSYVDRTARYTRLTGRLRLKRRMDAVEIHSDL